MTNALQTNSKAILNLMRSDGYITVNKKLAKAIGLNESIVYGELVSRYFYFADNDKLTDDGYFFNTIDDLEEATTLTRHQQPKAINRLCKLGLIDCKIKGIPGKRYFTINENSNILLSLIQETSQFTENQQTRKPKNREQESRKVATNNTNIISLSNKTNIMVDMVDMVAYDTQQGKLNINH